MYLLVISYNRSASYWSAGRGPKRKSHESKKPPLAARVRIGTSAILYDTYYIVKTAPHLSLGLFVNLCHTLW